MSEYKNVLKEYQTTKFENWYEIPVKVAESDSEISKAILDCLSSENRVMVIMSKTNSEYDKPTYRLFRTDVLTKVRAVQANEHRLRSIAEKFGILSVSQDVEHVSESVYMSSDTWVKYFDRLMTLGGDSYGTYRIKGWTFGIMFNKGSFRVVEWSCLSGLSKYWAIGVGV